MGNKKILIAEDSSVIQNIARKVLQFQNFNIETAKNGKEVLEKLAKETYDILLLDISMPVMDGIECAKQIRASTNPQHQTMPIIAITGNAKNYTLEEFRAVGINEYLPKPINFDALVELVRRLTYKGE
ncbi:MAG: response regulator [Microscillaceae bacterium]|nr:response regulator [Microscillaceae bacterium]MDW8460546.1 response regulator [Cytophagales bacterium]